MKGPVCVGIVGISAVFPTIPYARISNKGEIPLLSSFRAQPLRARYAQAGLSGFCSGAVR